MRAVTPAIGLALATAWCAAHEGRDHGDAEFTETEQHAPTVLPDRVVLTWSDDPASTVNVTWRTALAAGAPRVQYAPAEALVGDVRQVAPTAGQTVDGTRERFESDLGACAVNSASIRGLEPGATYAYRVGDGEYWSEWFQFLTASREPKPFTFVYFGDAQNEVRSLWSRVVREANQHAPRAAFMLHAGDLVNRANRDAEWGEWFGAAGWLNGMIPVVATPGNHEYDGGLSGHWRPQFAFPLNGPPGLEETAYWFDYQLARVVSLNSNEQIDVQARWLESVLEDENRPPWTVVTFHHPVFSAAKDRDNPAVREAWRPILEGHGVDLVLTGHDHAYARSGLGGPVNVADGVRRRESNTVYVVSVSGPKQYPLNETWDVRRVASGAQLFQVIKVEAGAIHYEARLASGRLYDAFRLEKDADGASRMIELTPDSEEVRER